MFAAMWLLLTPALASAEFLPTADRQYQYAETLFADHQYKQAADEYRRFLHFFPDDPRALEVEYRMGLSHYRGRDFQLAVQAFNRILDQPDFNGPFFSSYYMISQTQLAQDQVGSAVATLYNLAAVTEDQAEKDAAAYALGWLQLEHLWPEEPQGRVDSFQGACNNFDKISPARRDIYKLAALQAELDHAEAIPHKNPMLAGGLSIIPGGGQLYCERYQDALTALLVNAGFMAAAYESFDHELYALGSLITLVGAGFYAGNIWSAVGDAHKFNRDQRRRFISDLKTRLQIRFSAEKPFSFSLHSDF